MSQRAMTVGEAIEALRQQPPGHALVIEVPDPYAAASADHDVNRYQVAAILWRMNQTVVEVEEAVC